MKQITQEFNWEHVLFSIINTYREDFEDGFWQIGLTYQYTAGYHTHPNDNNMAVPSSLQRVLGIVISKVDDWYPNTLKVEKGVIHSGSNRNQNGPIESSESPGENSGSPGENLPSST